MGIKGFKTRALNSPQGSRANVAPSPLSIPLQNIKKTPDEGFRSGNCSRDEALVEKSTPALKVRTAVFPEVEDRRRVCVGGWCMVEGGHGW